MAPNISYWQKASKNHKQLLEIVSSAKNDTKEHVQVAKKSHRKALQMTPNCSHWYSAFRNGIKLLKNGAKKIIAYSS